MVHRGKKKFLVWISNKETFFFLLVLLDIIKFDFLIVFILDLMRLYCLFEWSSFVGLTLVSTCFLITIESM